MKEMVILLLGLNNKHRYQGLYDKKWAETWENVLSEIRVQRRFKSSCASAETDQSSLSAWKKRCIHGYPKCAQRRFWSDCAYAQDGLNLLWAHKSEGRFSDVVAHMDRYLTQNITEDNDNIYPHYIHTFHIHRWNKFVITCRSALDMFFFGKMTTFALISFNYHKEQTAL